MTYKIETVSFPFTPRDQEHTVGDRTMVMPTIESFQFVNGADARCTGYAWEANVPLAPNTKDLMRSVTGNINASNAGPQNMMSRPASLISALFKDYSVGNLCGSDAYRNWLPHTVLKHTIYVTSPGFGVADSISWVYDNTRGRMRHYPFTAFGTGQSPNWDVIFRPILLTNPNGHTYFETNNSSWYPNGTANYFPAPVVPTGLEDILYPSDPGNTVYPDPNYPNSLHPPPFSLLEAPLLNIDGEAYAGYTNDQNDDQQELFQGSPAWDVAHEYIIDKPIDLRLINAAEMIIYNPSEAAIDIDPSYPGRKLIFPSGYTFSTVHGVHPSPASVQTADPDGLYPHPLLAPVESTLPDLPGYDHPSIYYVRDGSTLEIEPCVTIMDATIYVEDGAAVRYYPGAINGNFSFEWENEAMSKVELAVPGDLRLCPGECYIADTYEVMDMTVTNGGHWTTTTLPNDANNDGHLLIGGTLRIASGQTVDISPGVVLEFGPNGKVIVERGAVLDATEATFTNACELMWQGIEVWGTTNASQEPTGGNPDQGEFYAYDCLFENARTAIKVYRPGHFDHNGGLVRVRYSTFRNNHMGIEMWPTQNMVGGIEKANRSAIFLNEFETTDFLLDPTYGDGIHRRAALEHIRLWGIKNPFLNGNDFTTAVPGHTFPPHLRGTGIMAFDSDVTVASCSFHGLTEGVWVANFPYFKGVRIRNNTFTDCVHSVVLQGTLLAEVTRNEIQVPISAAWPYADDDVRRGYNNPVGIYLIGSTNYHVEENTVTGSETQQHLLHKQYSFGIVASESMFTWQDTPDMFTDALFEQSSASIFLNRVTGCTFGIQMEGDNKGAYDLNDPTTHGYGLLVECNDMQDGGQNWWFDMAVVGNWTPGMTYSGVLRDQGYCDVLNPQYQAGNKFPSCDQEPFHLVFDINADATLFRYSDIASKLPAMLCREAQGALFIECDDLLGARECESTIDCDPPCADLVLGSLQSKLLVLEDLLSEATDSLGRDSLLRKHAALKAKQQHYHNAQLRYYLEAENMDSVLALVRRNEQQTELHWSLYFYMSKAMYAEADSIIDLMIAQGGGTPSAHTALVQLQLSLLNAQIAPENMTPAQHALLEAMVEENPYGSPSAQALLSLAYRTPYKRVPWLMNDTLPEKMVERPTATASCQLRCYPNPADDRVILVGCWDEGTTVSMHLYDAHGSRLAVAWRQQGQRLELDLSRFPSGLYMAVVHTALGTEPVRFLVR
ncbi:MAG: right-handed parallel beta-helix repeat-containing protein [Flavobacteriales bacterium]|nr:right-handed parallel beta-helix repeat-containing protein [Flavobacteriales bacterium]MBK7941362.1 right-handed parallel beta-helix repeat-containing protein [Flavobacteriales bacterium]MBK9701384.1 right-handed parallel beta-helix repeat-containing protein [Flavobacteriales bacterium]